MDNTSGGSIFDSIGDALNGVGGLIGSAGNIGEGIFGALTGVQNAQNQYEQSKHPVTPLSNQQLLIYGFLGVLAVIVISKVLK